MSTVLASAPAAVGTLPADVRFPELQRQRGLAALAMPTARDFPGRRDVRILPLCVVAVVVVCASGSATLPALRVFLTPVPDRRLPAERRRSR